MSSLDVTESKIGPFWWNGSRVADLGRSKPYRDLGLCVHPIGKKNYQFLGLIGTDVSC